MRLSVALAALVVGMGTLSGQAHAQAQAQIAAPPPPQLQPAAPAPAPASAPARPPPVYVLTPDSNDADEQAEALAVAIRSHVRETGGPGALGETPNSLAMFQQALRCPAYTDPTCLDKIAAQLKTNRFVWGRINRGGGKITAVLHYYVKGRPDRAHQVTYSDNLREANDESLRQLAGSLYDQLSGIPTTGSVRVRVLDVPGSLYVDGERRTRLDHGGATATLSLGHHNVEIRATGYEPVHQAFDIHGGEDAVLEPRLLPLGTVAESEGPSTRHIVGYGALGAGVLAGVVGGLFAGKYFSDVSAAKSDRTAYAGAATCGDHLSAAIEACNDRTDGQRDSALAWTFSGVGAALLVTGTILLTTGSEEADKGHVSRASDAPSPATGKLRLSGFTPTFGANAGGMSLSGSF